MDPFNPNTQHLFMPQPVTDERCEGLSFVGLVVGAATSVALAGGFFAMFGYQLLKIGRVLFG